MWMSHVTIDRAYCAIWVSLVVSLTCKRVMSSDLCKLPFQFQIVHSPCGPQTPSSKELHVSSVWNLGILRADFRHPPSWISIAILCEWAVSVCFASSMPLWLGPPARTHTQTHTQTHTHTHAESIYTIAHLKRLQHRHTGTQRHGHMNTQSWYTMTQPFWLAPQAHTNKHWHTRTHTAQHTQTTTDTLIDTQPHRHTGIWINRVIWINRDILINWVNAHSHFVYYLRNTLTDTHTRILTYTQP